MNRMINDLNYRKTSKCSYYQNYLADKIYPLFPITKIYGSNTFIDHNTLYEFHKPLLIISEDLQKEIGLLIPKAEICDKNLNYISNLIGIYLFLKIFLIADLLISMLY